MCTWKVLAPSGRRVKLDSFGYSIEGHNTCTYDGLKIYDGPSTNEKRIERLCGRGTSHEIQSSENTLFLTFYSDGGTHYKGFQIRYSLIGKLFYKLYSFYITIIS